MFCVDDDGDGVDVDVCVLCCSLACCNYLCLLLERVVDIGGGGGVNVAVCVYCCCWICCCLCSLLLVVCV